MREILFRAKRVDNAKWVEGSLLVTVLNTYIVPLHDDTVMSQRAYSVFPETVGQFTGLRDKNGEKIFDGDICKVTYYNHSSPDTVLQQTVIYSNGTFALQSKDFEPFDFEDTRRYVPLYYMLPPNNIEIIGNIHDNNE